MDVASTNQWTYGKHKLQLEQLLEENTNPVYHISFRMKEIVEVLKGIPICEIRQLPYWDRPIHVVVEADAQKLIQLFHRNGPRPSIEDAPKCPITGGNLRSRFTSLIGENNLLSAYQGESERYRTALSLFFTRRSMEVMTQKWNKITQNWLEVQFKKGNEVNLFDEVLHLVGTCLIVGMLGYEECSDEDVNLNCQFWRDLFSPMPDELKPLQTQIKEGKPGLVGGILKACSNIIPLGQKLWTYKMDSSYFQGLADKIVSSTCAKEGTLCYFLRENHRFTGREAVETIRGMLLAGQESTGYLLGFMLYEYAKNPNIQEEHSREVQLNLADGNKKLKSMYLETLRFYPIGGSLREAERDQTIIYPDPDNNQKAKEDYKYKKHYIRKGDWISCYPQMAGHNPNLWGEDVEKFDPTRKDLDKVRTHVVPFGSGEHGCLGQKAAEKEIMTLAGRILEQAKLLTEDTIEDCIDTFTLRPIKDVKVTFEKREK
jgi:cytochrome P450